MDEIAPAHSPETGSTLQYARNEQRWLGALAACLPVAIPAPVRVGRPEPALGYDAPWSIVPWLDGRSALDVDAPERTDAATAPPASSRSPTQRAGSALSPRSCSSRCWRTDVSGSSSTARAALELSTEVADGRLSR